MLDVQRGYSTGLDETIYLDLKTAVQSSDVTPIGQYLYDLLSVICIFLVVMWVIYHVIAWIRIVWNHHQNDSNEQTESRVTAGSFPIP